MLTPRFYLLLLRFGLPTTIIFLYFGMEIFTDSWLESVKLVLLVLGCACVAYLVAFWGYRNKKGRCFRLGFMMKEGFWRLLVRMAFPVMLVLFVATALLAGYSWRLVVLLVIGVIVEVVVGYAATKYLYGRVMARYRMNKTVRKR